VTTPVRQRAVTVVVCAAAAGLALFAASRTWTVETVARPAPLPPQVTTRNGSELVPALPALALVALAGAGGLLATRAWGRRLVAGLILLAGLGLAGLAVGRGGWALVVVAAGLVVAAAGAYAWWRGPTWPSLGVRYERTTRADGATRTEKAEGAAAEQPVRDPAAPVGPSTERTESGAESSDIQVDSAEEAVSQALWDAIERGEDPTKS
jgi:hypothetical protein